VRLRRGVVGGVAGAAGRRPVPHADGHDNAWSRPLGGRPGDPGGIL